MLKVNETEALRIGREYIKKHHLPMTLLSISKRDEEHITFYFKAKTRVDFRALVKDLNNHFKTKVALRQVGGREAAKALGNIGKCGRTQLCCTQWESTFPKISSDIINQLGLEGPTSQYIGACGKLLCCLAFELENFKFPKRAEFGAKTVDKIPEPPHIEEPKPKAKEQKMEPKEKKPSMKRIRRIIK